ncbi:chorismate synthase [Gammaproteobacteria bacterium]|nr:chorismate synthase [Gammaproteobacteria bacterium]
MAGNTIGKLFCVTGFGESHGLAIGAVVDGCPPGVVIDTASIQRDLDRRKPGTSRFTTQRREDDEVEILSGVFEGKSTGAPIALLIHNRDQRSKDYSQISQLYRPGHADYTYDAKYGFRDYRGGGRSSARETAGRVAAGAIARLMLEQQFGVRIRGYIAAIGSIEIAADTDAPNFDWDVVDQNPFFSPVADAVPALEALIDGLRRDGDSIGARVNVVAEGVPVGLGEPVFDRLDAEIAHGLMSINAVKAVEIGAGFASVHQRGSEHRDEMQPGPVFTSNNAGGILGGISNGNAITASIALKPTSSITTPGQTINRDGEAAEVVTRGRHDPCVGIRAVPIAEAHLAITLADHLLRQRGQCG